MSGMIYLVYDDGILLAGFMSLVVALNFIENWRTDSDVAVDLVDAATSEVVDTWVNGKWENGVY